MTQVPGVLDGEMGSTNHRALELPHARALFGLLENGGVLLKSWVSRITRPFSQM